MLLPLGGGAVAVGRGATGVQVERDAADAIVVGAGLVAAGIG